MRNVIDMRLLELRSGLFFEYPSFSRDDTNLLFFLPFWENPIVTENKEARLVEYNLINRGSAIFAHTGAHARNIGIEFTLTLPHIMRSMNSVLNTQRLLETLSTESEKKKFKTVDPFENEVPTTTAEDVIRHWGELVLETNIGRIEAEEFPGQQYIPQGEQYPEGNNWISLHNDDNAGVVTSENLRTGEVVRNVHADAIPVTESATALRAINTVVFILNIIRSCTAGDAVNSILGPPLLRLRHGASYSDVPLICRDYDISVEEDAGYDLKTLLPNRMKVTLNTHELRTGNFGRFEPGVFVSRDNLAGWEAVLSKGTMDPGFLKR